MFYLEFCTNKTITHTDNRQPIKLDEDYIDLIHAAPLKYKIYSL